MIRTHILLVLCFCGNATYASEQGQIIISNSVHDQIDKLAQMQLYSVPIDKENLRQNRKLIRSWVSGSINLDKAVTRKHRYFDRISYRIETKEEALRYPEERLKIDSKGGPNTSASPKRQDVNVSEGAMPLLDRTQIKTNISNRPVIINYREGYADFRFLKTKEIDSVQKLTRKDAINSAKLFIERNNFVNETQDDKIAEVYIQERLSNFEQPGGEGHEVLHQQDVVFQRKYQGKPVINSKIVVGFQPDSRDIVSFKHYNWTSAVDRSSVKNSDQIQAKNRGKISTKHVLDRLENKIVESTGDFISAKVTGIIPAWFQTKEELIPVLAFEVAIKHSTTKGLLERDYLEVINLSGDDNALLPGRNSARDPIRAE